MAMAKSYQELETGAPDRWKRSNDSVLTELLEAYQKIGKMTQSMRNKLTSNN